MCVAPIPFKRIGKGKIKIYWEADETQLADKDFFDGFFPCGKCVECQIQYSSEWALRCCQEMRYHNVACFVTLTYNEQHYPLNGVQKRDIQLFIKRLRNDRLSLRYFACGEYGGKTLRPHYHLILFGFVPGDLVFIMKDEKGNDLYTSMYLLEKWDFKGYISVGLSYDVNSIKYCCKYLQKELSLKITNLGLNPSFVLMSRKPLLGLRVYDLDTDNDFEYYKGKKYSRPRAYTRIIPPFLLNKSNPRGYNYSMIDNKKKKIENILRKPLDD